MKRAWWNVWVLIGMISVGAGSLACAQGKTDIVDGAQGAAKTASDEATLAAAGKPFTTKITIDSHTPVAYGDDVLVSVWITPREDVDVQYVRLHPAGDLANIYESTERVAAVNPDEADAIVDGASCRVGATGHLKGEPFLVICQLTSLHQGWWHWVERTALLESGRQQVEIEVALQRGLKAPAVYYDSATFDFVCPKLAVILGGFAGALVYSLIVFCVTPIGRAPLIAGWFDLWSRGWKQVPQAIVSILYFFWRVVHGSLLGGVTAAVLIILAKSSQGFEPPISLSIQDFWGGMLIGLLSVYLSKWVMKKIEQMFQADSAVDNDDQPTVR